MTDQLALERFRSGDSETLGWIYLHYYEFFIKWLMKRYRCNKSQAEDAYQDAICILGENIIKEKITEVKKSLESYLFEIGKLKWLEANRKDRRYSDPLEFFLFETGASDNPWETDDTQEILENVYRAIEELGDPCKKNLMLFFIEDKPDKDIVQLMGYKNTNTAKTSRYKCLERLRILLFN